MKIIIQCVEQHNPFVNKARIQHWNVKPEMFDFVRKFVYLSDFYLFHRQESTPLLWQVAILCAYSQVVCPR